MNFIRKSEKGIISVLLVLALLISAVACAGVAGAKEIEDVAMQGAENYYLWGLNTNDPDFGAMSSPTGSFAYDGTKGYYYYDLHGASGDYCFVVSKINNSGATAVRTPALGGVANSGKYYLQQGNYHGYACLHLWNPAGDDIRLYFASENAGINAIPLSEAGNTPTNPPTPTTGPAPTTPSGSRVVYCQNDAGWAEVYVYMWNSTGNNGDWPGQKMTNTGNGLWRYTPDKDYDKIIFNIGSDVTQTTDLDYPGNGYTYNNKTGEWKKSGDNPPTPTTGPTPTTAPVPTTAPTPTTPPSGGKFVYCENEANWSTVTVYMWDGSGTSNNGTWPGQPATKIGSNIWRYTMPKTYENIIFSENGQNQTTDLRFPGAGYMYNNSTKEWTIYDTSPLQVQEYTTDLAAPQFAGTAIVLTATAAGQGTVRYKFSATNSSGATTVIADYSTKNTAVWTPRTAGAYTLTFEFKDTSGNTNKRTLTYQVDDGLTSVAPFIKQVTPLNGAQIKKSSACSVSVAAGGGITGSNLLFYKYTVKDASGNVINTPYYTRQTSYSFTPTALGNYTVTVSVQGSDNATVERDYVYSSVNTVITPTEPPEEPTSSEVTPTTPGGSTKKGDADGDGSVTILDATRIQRWLAGLISAAEVYMKNADADGDGSVTILDATRIQRLLAGLITSL